MKERAKEILLKLKSEKKEFSEVFNNYVKHLVVELEIDESLAVTLVTDELVNQYERISGQKRLPYKAVLVIDEAARFLDEGKSLQHNDSKDWDIFTAHAATLNKKITVKGDKTCQL